MEALALHVGVAGKHNPQSVLRDLHLDSRSSRYAPRRMALPVARAASDSCRANVETGSVPRAGYRGPLERSLGQRPSPMRAGGADSIEGPINIEERDLVPFGLDGHAFSWGKAPYPSTAQLAPNHGHAVAGPRGCYEADSQHRKYLH